MKGGRTKEKMDSKKRTGRETLEVESRERERGKKARSYKEKRERREESKRKD